MKISPNNLSSYSYRVIKRFALFPIKINYSSRWLETVYIRQRRHKNGLRGWESMHFVTERDYRYYQRERGLLW